MRKIILGFILTVCFWVTSSLAAVVGHEVTYSAGGVTMKGYLARDEGLTGLQPGVLVVHEWWGHNDYTRKRATMLAEMGYVALAVDMYGDGKVAKHPDEAQSFSKEAIQNFPVAKGRFEAALNLLREQPHVAKTKIAAIGYCFGGGVVLNMARQGVDLKGVASFHGSLDPMQSAVPGGIRSKILVLTGETDPMVPSAKVEAFKEEMTRAGADFKVISYPGATHSFTNPDADALGREFKLPIAYNKEADQQSWEALRQFLVQSFGS
ncbi:MAG: dienelactone hydrolase family protein [Magnetococcales bacterium]|nr:dienelactone hydrolase family protein [Magnetococcales bacterium]